MLTPRAGFDGSPILFNHAFIDMPNIDAGFLVADPDKFGQIPPLVSLNEKGLRSTEIRKNGRSQTIRPIEGIFGEAFEQGLIAFGEVARTMWSLLKERQLSGDSASGQHQCRCDQYHCAHWPLPQLVMGRSVAARHGGRNV